MKNVQPRISEIVSCSTDAGRVAPLKSLGLPCLWRHEIQKMDMAPLRCCPKFEETLKKISIHRDHPPIKHGESKHLPTKIQYKSSKIVKFEDNVHYVRKWIADSMAILDTHENSAATRRMGENSMTMTANHQTLFWQFCGVHFRYLSAVELIDEYSLQRLPLYLTEYLPSNG